MKVYKIDEDDISFLRDKKMPNGSTYNVDVKDANNNTIISKEQWIHCRRGVEIDYEPIESEE